MIQDRLRIELLGSFLGVAASFSLAQMGLSIEKYLRMRTLLKKLYEELKTIKSNLETLSVGYILQTPVWEFSKNAGLLEYTDEETTLLLATAYTVPERVNQDIRLRDAIALAKNQGRAKEIRKDLRSLSMENLKILDFALDELRKKHSYLE